MSKDSVLRPVVWMGDSKKQLKKMPEDVQKQMGGELYLAQRAALCTACISEEKQKGHRDTPERRGVDYAAI